ncbi:MAG: polyphosphate--glucose phosphotransferase [Flavicella sp.]
MEILGIDIGGTGIKGAIVDIETGTLVTEKFRVPTPLGACPKDIAIQVGVICKHFNWKGKVGCGFPAIIANGIAKSCGNIDESWLGIDVGALFHEVTGLDFYVANDADVAGLAEIHFGVAKKHSGMVVMLTVGTGLGSGVFFNQILVPNVELGAIPYKKYKRIEHFTANSVRKNENLSFSDFGKRLNEFLKITVTLFSPELIVLGGGVSKKLHKFENEFSVEVPVVAAALQNNAGIVGAAMLVPK